MRTGSRLRTSRLRAGDPAIAMRGSTMRAAKMLLAAALSAVAAAGAARAEVIRHPIPNSTFPIAQAVEVSGNVKTVYVSGQVPPVIDKDADENSAQGFGDNKKQTVG